MAIENMEQCWTSRIVHGLSIARIMRSAIGGKDDDVTGSVAIGDRTLTLTELHRRASCVATGLAALGVGAADSVAIYLRNDLAFLEVVLGVGLLGAYSVPINWQFKREEAGYVIADSGAKVLVVHSDLLAEVKDTASDGLQILVVPTPVVIRAAYDIGPEATHVADGFTAWDPWREAHEPWRGPPALSPGSMIYTSGTTGQPKGVRRIPAEVADLESASARIANAFGARPGMKAIMTGPLYHSAPLGYARAVLGAGGGLTLMPRFDAESLLRLIEEQGVTDMHMVPTMFVRLLRLPGHVRRHYDISSLRYVIHGAAPCPPDVKRQMIDWWGPVIHEYYGSTEVGLATVVDSADWLKHPGTVGRPLTGVKIRIYANEGWIRAPGQQGEIYVGLESITPFTYHNNDQKRREIERDGMVTNGDIGYFDDEGFLYLCDRKIDMVISGGVNIYPVEVEKILAQLDGVRDCAVFGVPDPEFGEVLAAAIEPDNDHALTETSVRRYLADHLASYKIPRVIAFHDTLPREDSGKLFKRKLREPYWRDVDRRI